MSVQENTLYGKVVLVTGAGSGLGEATARAFAAKKALVVCVDLNKVAAERVTHELEAHDARAMALSCDVSSAEAVFSAVQTVVEHFGSLDIVVNCAAIDHTVSVEEMSVEQWDQVMGVNLRGPFLLAKAAWPIMNRITMATSLMLPQLPRSAPGPMHRHIMPRSVG